MIPDHGRAWKEHSERASTYGARFPRLLLAGVLLASVGLLGCNGVGEGDTEGTTAVTLLDSDGGISEVQAYEPGVCPFPMVGVTDEAGGVTIGPKMMSEHQPSLKDAAFQAARPCFTDGAFLYFREAPFGDYPGDTRAQVSDGARCFQFGHSSGGGQWRVGGLVDRCKPFGSDAAE
jgi:hypothetical protein